MGHIPYSGTSHILKISWADGRCWALTPAEGLWKSQTVFMTADCHRSPSRIRIETHRGYGDEANILSVVVDEPFDVDEEDAEDVEETRQKDTLCIADFGQTWLETALERHCVYEHVMGEGKK